MGIVTTSKNIIAVKTLAFVLLLPLIASCAAKNHLALAPVDQPESRQQSKFSPLDIYSRPDDHLKMAFLQQQEESPRHFTDFIFDHSDALIARKDIPAPVTPADQLDLPRVLNQPDADRGNSFADPGDYTIKFVSPATSKIIGSYFGMRYHPIKHRKILHAGVDIRGKRGEKVVSAAGGKVIYSGRHGAYGLMIDIELPNGMVTRYAHLNKLGVKKGQTVKQGQYIGEIGSTGRVTSAHLHFEVRINNKPVNPMRWLDPDHVWASNVSKRK